MMALGAMLFIKLLTQGSSWQVHRSDVNPLLQEDISSNTGVVDNGWCNHGSRLHHGEMLWENQS